MAGPVTPSCHAFRVELTELLLLDRPLPAPLARHLARCADCSAEAAGVRRVIRTFERAEPLLPGAAVPAPRPEAPPRRTARRRAAAATAGLVLAAAAVLALLLPGGMGPPGDGHEGRPDAAVTLSRPAPMIEHSWGTEVPVSLSGLRPGRTYRLLTGDAHGRRQSAGSVRAGGGEAPMRTRMVTAMARSEITALLVQDESGHTVARLAVPHPTAPPR
ncbi:hypothetical protein [Actinomadura geliboluensis]|uniref:Zf-HC2 domain-containing protein n=1 Tax=Actinomadura geliboluensis TaxID=882440 RepID=A0A5S4H5Z1_9ACTN|nr:hypothetical protein [Actinomadura geliboluensis]TMR40643.1 hypothetical protein ETD96_09825 [Actinomadura geliboluensis]